MEERYVTQLPPELRTLVAEIETAAGSEINVQRVPNLEFEMLAKISYGDCAPGMAPWSFSCAPTFRPVNEFVPPWIGLFEPRATGNPAGRVSAELHYKGDLAAAIGCYKKPYAIAAHELLHMKRCIIDKVPIVFDIKDIPRPGGIFSVQGLEQALEHAVIEPRVKDYGIEYPLQFCCREIWDTVPPQPWKQPFVVRWCCMDEWVKVVFENCDAGITARAEEVLNGIGLLDDARLLTDAMSAAMAMPDPIAGKERMALAACVAYQIPPAYMKLLYNGTNGRPASEVLRRRVLQPAN